MNYVRARFFQANGQAFPETESKHPSLRAGAGYNIIDAGGSRTKYYSSLQERVGAALYKARAGVNIVSRADL